jgi:S-formylglutathione hydrolase FrmB
VLYLLTASTQEEWPTYDPHLQDIADEGVIIVLPARGFGFYTDWADGSHHFETLYTRELIADVDDRYRTIPDRGHRALAGASKAGYGAMVFAARHPDLYAGAASFSGLVDIGMPGFPEYFTAVMSSGFATYDDPSHPMDNPVWGNPVTDEVGWHATNPTDLATNLRGISLYAAAGDGEPGDPELASGDPTTLLGASEEAIIRRQNETFDQALTAAGIQHTYVTHGGTHYGAYWVQELHDWVPTMRALFAHPAPDPSAFDYRSADSVFSVWGWTFRADPARAKEFLDITGASATGITLRGSGRTEVETGALFTPGQSVTVADEAGHRTIQSADSTGRLRFAVDLGRPHTDQAYTAPARAREALPGYFTSRVVRFSWS